LKETKHLSVLGKCMNLIEPTTAYISYFLDAHMWTFEGRIS